MPTDKPDDTSDNSRPPSSPYGPHPGHVDDASGGADSSPFENMSSDERAARLRAARKDEQPDDEEPGPRH